jgi:hypothetical protein
MCYSRVISACVGLALLLTGCDPVLEAQYTHEGIGTSLYWDGLPAATQLQDIYLANLCGQALSNSAASLDNVACSGLNLRSKDWGLIVQAGMNDIDLRCDAYLSWLHDKQASREPILKEIALLGGATAAILKATEVSATPIALTAIAFGLAADSFTDAGQLLLNEVDYTTVQTVVRDNRTQFRLSNLNQVIDNRPAAVYMLRNYLSICVPASIAMSINNTLTVYHRAGPEALLNDSPLALRNPVATSATSAAVRGVSFTRNADTSQPPARRSDATAVPAIAKLFVNYDPNQDTQPFATDLARKLCLTDGDVTNTAKMSTAIKIYQMTRNDYQHLASTVTGKLTDAEVQSLNNATTCDSTKFANYFEANGTPGGINNPDVIHLLNTKLSSNDQLTATATVDQIRARISQVRGSLSNLTLSGSLVAKQWTPDLLQALTPPK